MSANVPAYFICPISKLIMEDPVLWMDGNTYERREIERWLAKHKINTATSAVPYRNVLFPNRAIKAGIETFLAQNAPRSGKRKAAPEESTDIPDRFICPLSERIMRDPVICADGFTYERSEIERWLVACHTSPKTGNELRDKTLTANDPLKTELIRFDWEEYVRRTHSASFRIFVKPPTGPNITLDVHNNDLVSDITLALYRRGQGLPETQRMSFQKNVENNSTLRECHIERGSTLLLAHISVPQIAPISLMHMPAQEHTVGGEDGRLVKVPIEMSDTVKTLKELVLESVGIPPDQQRFIYAGRQMEEGRTLEEYGVKNGDSLQLVLRERGC